MLFKINMQEIITTIQCLSLAAIQMAANKGKKKKISCFIGEHLSEQCSLNWFKCTLPSELVHFSQCQDDIASHLTSLGLPSDKIDNCPNANERRLILSRSKMNAIPDKALICPKHRFKFGIGWQPPMSCQYPLQSYL